MLFQENLQVGALPGVHNICYRPNNQSDVCQIKSGGGGRGGGFGREKHQDKKKYRQMEQHRQDGPEDKKKNLRIKEGLKGRVVEKSRRPTNDQERVSSIQHLKMSATNVGARWRESN